LVIVIVIIGRLRLGLGWFLATTRAHKIDINITGVGFYRRTTEIRKESIVES